MAVYLITYDLHKPNKDYTSLYNAIKTYSKWWHYMDSCWLIITDDSVTQIQAHLRNLIDNDDDLLIIRVQRSYGGWLPQKAWDWMNENSNEF